MSGRDLQTNGTVGTQQQTSYTMATSKVLVKPNRGITHSVREVLSPAPPASGRFRLAGTPGRWPMSTPAGAAACECWPASRPGRGHTGQKPLIHRGSRPAGPRWWWPPNYDLRCARGQRSQDKKCSRTQKQASARHLPVGENLSELTLISGLKWRELMSPWKGKQNPVRGGNSPSVGLDVGPYLVPLLTPGRLMLTPSPSPAPSSTRAKLPNSVIFRLSRNSYKWSRATKIPIQTISKLANLRKID